MVLTYQDLGQNKAGTDEALFIPVAADEVLLSYESKVIIDSRVMTKTAAQGAESTQFDMLGDASTIFREIGKSILRDQTDGTNPNTTPSSPGTGAKDFLSTVAQGRVKVFLDRPILGGPVFDDDFQKLLSTLANGGQAPILSKLGYAIAKDADILAMLLMLKGAAPSSHTDYINWGSTAVTEIPNEFLPATPGDNWILDANAKTDGSALLDAIRQMTEFWDDNDVPEEGRHVVLRPAQYNLLVQNQDLLNRDFGGQNGIFSDGTVFRAWGAALVKSNLLPIDATYASVGRSSDIGIRNKFGYDFDASNVAALGFQSDAFAKVRSAGMTLQVKDYGFEYGGTAMAAEMAMGHDIFRPIGLGAIATA